MARTAGSIGAETAKRVLNEALSLIARHGYAAVSTRQIANACGLQVGALYNHFPTKQAILHALMADHMRTLLDVVEQESLSLEDPTIALEQFAGLHVRFHIDKPREVFIASMELRNLEDGPYREVMQMRQAYERQLRAILKAGKHMGVFDLEDVPVTAMAILSMMTGLHAWYRFGGRLEPKEIERLFVKMVLAAAGAQTVPDSKRKEEFA